MPRLRPTIAPAAALLALALASAAAARERIGGATAVERDVTGALPGEERKVAQGDDVYLAELIRTASASAAKIRFVDETSLSLGPLAAVRLDAYVFNPDRTAKAFAVTMTKGAMRWVSGISPSSAYRIKTPQAIIGVRGTIFDLVADGRRTTVVLQEGAVEVCTTGARRRCRMLTRKGDVITVAGNAVEGPRPGGPGASDFAGRCLAASSRTCAVTAGAEPAPSARPRTKAAEKPEAERPRTRAARHDPPHRALPRRRIVQAGPAVEDEIVPVRRRRVVEVHEPGAGRPWRPRYDVPIRLRPPHGGRPGGAWPRGRGIGLGYGSGHGSGHGLGYGLGHGLGRFGPPPGRGFGAGRLGSVPEGFAMGSFRGGGFGPR
jgi:hypothetical protein